MANNLKVLHVIESLGRGGAEQALVNLLPALAKRGIKSEVAALWGPYPLAMPLKEKGIVVHQLDVRHRWSMMNALTRIAALCRRGRYDIIHAHLFFGYFYVALTAPLLPRSKRIVSFHNETFIGYPANTMWKRVRKALERRLVRRRFHRYIAVSNAVAEHYNSHFGLSPVDVIHNAFPLDILRPDPNLNRAKIRQRFRLSDNDFVIVMPGRLVHQKGHSVLLEALCQLRDHGLMPRTLIFGDGPLEMTLRDTIHTCDLAAQVQIFPALDHSRLLEVVQSADLFVMPSLFEGFGLAPAEAMALQRPVVASRVGGLTDLIEDNQSGILVPPQDPAALAGAISRLMLDEQERRRLGAGGRARIESRFSVDVIADQYAGYYHALQTVP